MLKNLLGAFALLFTINAHAQLNLTLKSHVPFPQGLNDIWGYSADGREYALIGTQTGLSIYDITDTENPVDKGFIPGPESTWRDIKVWDSYAYVTNETGGGLNVVNLSNLPGQITEADAFRWEPNISEIGGTLGPCHNIYIDDNGVGYLTGCNLNDGGVFFVDLFTDPGSPAYISAAPAVYSHDAYVRDNILYSSQIYEGTLAIFDVSDLQNVQLLATQPTPFDFTHNAWLSDDGNTVYTTDEVGDAPVASYDISDLSDIKELDQFRPIATINEGVLPHNVFVWDDWLIISYYTDGCILADGTRPDNIIEVGNFDTVLPGGGSGAWGVYPFYESQTIVVSDIEQGFFVLEPNFVRACWLEGNITNAVTGAPVDDALVEIASSIPNFTNSELSGVYKTGQAVAGTFDVAFSHPAYYSKTVTGVVLENGELTIQDVELDPLPTTAVTIQVVNAETNAPINNVKINLTGQGLSIDQNTDGSGTVAESIVSGGYAASFAKWGYHEKLININPTDGETIVVGLTPGYKDDFIFDQGWEVVSSADEGMWERGVPVGTDAGGQDYSPSIDILGDLGNQCYVTGNGGGSVNNDDIDGGFTRLTSPEMDLTTYDSPTIQYDIWFTNNFGGGPINDYVDVKIDNGLTEVLLERVEGNEGQWRPTRNFVLSEYIDITNEMRLIVEAEDVPQGNVVEAAFDRFIVVDAETGNDFQTSSTSGCSPVTVSFADFNDDATAWDWTFEGGDIASSDIATPEVVFIASGSYNVNLTTTTPSGTYTFNQIINVTVFEEPVPAFSYTELANNQLVFNNESMHGVDFLWEFGDGTTSTAPNPTHTFDEAGAYVVKLTVFNPCDVNSTLTGIIVGSVNTNNLSDDLTSWTVFPNPFQESITIDFDYAKSFQKAEVQVYSTIGELIKTTPVTTGQNSIDLPSGLPAGLYFVKMEIDGEVVAAEKLVK